MARYTVSDNENSRRTSDAGDAGQALGEESGDAARGHPIESAPAAGSGEDVFDANDPLIGQLRSLYDDVAAEPLPDRLLELLAKLDEAERKR